MTQDETINRILDAESLKRLPGARLVAVKWRHHNNWLGEPSLRVWVILDENLTQEEASTFQTVEPMDIVIRDRLQEAGVDLFPYINFVKQSDLDELGVKL